MKPEILLVKNHKRVKELGNYYEATRGYWKLSSKRLPTIEMVVGINNKEVFCAYSPSQWYTVEDGARNGRKYFVGKEVSEAVLLKLKDSAPLLLSKFGAGCAIAYIDCDEFF